MPAAIHPDYHEPDDDDDSVLESATIDKEAHKAATSHKNDLPEPTQAQKEAGNYKKGHVAIHGLDISIENPVGSERSGVDPNGEKWSVVMPAHYGYVKRTKAPDGDHFDVYIGENIDSDRVFIVDQLDIETGIFDECKGIIGCESAEEARDLYCKGFSDGKGPDRIGAITELSMESFKKWLRDGDTMKPASNTILESAKDIFGEEIPPNGWIGCDLDGTLAEYDGIWRGYEHIGEPIPLMMLIIKSHLAKGDTVKIFTARATDPESIPPIKTWCQKHGLGDLEVTNIKDHNMIKLYDDRAAKVIPNMGVVLEDAETQDWQTMINSAKSFEDIKKAFSSVFSDTTVRAKGKISIKALKEAYQRGKQEGKI